MGPDPEVWLVAASWGHHSEQGADTAGATRHPCDVQRPRAAWEQGVSQLKLGEQVRETRFLFLSVGSLLSSASSQPFIISAEEAALLPRLLLACLLPAGLREALSIL